MLPSFSISATGICRDINSTILYGTLSRFVCLKTGFNICHTVFPRLSITVTILLLLVTTVATQLCWASEYHRPGQSTIHRNRFAILHVLSGPFRNHEAVACFPHSRLAWESVLILRRLVLILIFEITYDGRWRILSALIACVFILVIHLYVRPFRKKWVNFLETSSLTTLVVFCAITLVKALYRGEDYSSLYTSSTFMYSLNMFESVLIIFPLAAIVVVVFILLLIKLVRLFRMCCRKMSSIFSVPQNNE